MPHSAPRAGQVHGVQPHFFEIDPPPHVSGGTQWPQCTVPPHPSETSPQLAPSSAQVLGEQGSTPHLLRPPPPHTPIRQDPQSRRLPHPSGMTPHSAPTASQVLGVQVGASASEVEASSASGAIDASWVSAAIDASW